MYAQKLNIRRGEEGYALMTVTMFVLVIIIAGMAFFAMSSYETLGALYRQESSEAFYLADGAVERSRAKFLEDRNWRDGWVNQAAGRGTYDLAVTDTSFMGFTDVVQLLANGYVGEAERRIEVMAQVPPTAYGLSILVMGDADVNGNLCLDGSAHVNGTADFGPNDSHLACGEYTSGYEIIPPYVYTDAGHFPDATYYDVRATTGGPTGAYAKIFKNGFDITEALLDSLQDVMTYNNGQKEFVLDFDSGAELDFYFDDNTGIFSRDPGDVAVVVNFGGTPLNDPNAVCTIILDGPSTDPLHTTILNARFTGVLEEQRSDTNFWTGGNMFVKQLEWEPYHGIATISGAFEKQGGALAYIGNENWPALVYVTGDVIKANANVVIHGAMIVLGDWHSTGGPDITYDEGFLQYLPEYLAEDWQSGVSGTLTVLRWREIAVPTS